MKAHYADVGIINMIRQRLKDIKLQRWLSEINNDIRKDAYQSNKMRTYWIFKMIGNYKCEDYLHLVTNTCFRITLAKLQLSNHKLAIETEVVPWLGIFVVCNFSYFEIADVLFIVDDSK